MYLRVLLVCFVLFLRLLRFACTRCGTAPLSTSEPRRRMRVVLSVSSQKSRVRRSGGPERKTNSRKDCSWVICHLPRRLLGVVWWVDGRIDPQEIPFFGWQRENVVLHERTRT